MSNLSLWSARGPFAEFDELVRRAFGAEAPSWPAGPSGFRPAAEVSRDGDDAVIRVEVPGVDVANDLVVEVEREQLVVRGERRDERSAEGPGRGVRSREVRYGRFERAWTLPEHVTAEAVSASHDAGVLTVRVAGLYGSSPERAVRRVPVTYAGATEPGTTEHGTTEHGTTERNGEHAD
ncbi:MAG: Hsp20/alpha crystallin family protein [Pseudonocardia sp.]|jgi:HSP20 family protein